MFPLQIAVCLKASHMREIAKVPPWRESVIGLHMYAHVQGFEKEANQRNASQLLCFDQAGAAQAWG